MQICRHIMANIAIILYARHTILPLPEHNKASEADEKEHPCKHRLPLRCRVVHLSKALFEADAVH